MFTPSIKMLVFILVCLVAVFVTAETYNSASLYPDDKLACSYSIRMLYLHDASADFECEQNEIKTQLKLALQRISEARQGSAFKLASFSDLPFFPFSDCAGAAASPYESHGVWSSDPDVFADSLGKMTFYQCGDKMQAQLMGIANAIDVGEFETTVSYEEGKPIKNVIVLATNSDFHSTESVERYIQQETIPGSPLSGTCNILREYGSMGRECCDVPFDAHSKTDWNSDGKITVPSSSEKIFENFPTYNQIGAALKKANAALIILKMESEDTPFELETINSHYTDLLTALREYYGILSTFANYSKGSESLADELTGALGSLESSICTDLKQEMCIQDDAECLEGNSSVALDSKDTNFNCSAGICGSDWTCKSATPNQLLACYSMPAWPLDELFTHTSFQAVDDWFVTDQLVQSYPPLLPSKSGAYACQSLLQLGHYSGIFPDFELPLSLQYFVYNADGAGGPECVFVDSLPDKGIVSSTYRAGPMFCEVCG